MEGPRRVGDGTETDEKSRTRPTTRNSLWSITPIKVHCGKPRLPWTQSPLIRIPMSRLLCSLLLSSLLDSEDSDLSFTPLSSPTVFPKNKVWRMGVGEELLEVHLTYLLSFDSSINESIWVPKIFPNLWSSSGHKLSYNDQILHFLFFKTGVKSSTELWQPTVSGYPVTDFIRTLYF